MEINWFSPNGEKILTKRDNLEVRNHGNSLSSLIVLNANLNHAGTYKCVARNGDTETQATVKLDILCKYLHYEIQFYDFMTVFMSNLTFCIQCFVSNYYNTELCDFTITCIHLADAFIKSD